MTRPSKREIEREIEGLGGNDGRDETGISVVYEHPETGEQYNCYKTPVGDSAGIVITYPWHMAPFVVEREKADAEEWGVVESVETPADHHRSDLVEVSEWCVNTWVDNSEDREVVSGE